MSHSLDSVEFAFASQPNIKRKIYAAIQDQPQHAQLFDDIAQFIISLPQDVSGVNGTSSSNHEPPVKKRKLEEPGSAHAAPSDKPRRVLLEARDISFALPQRKKLHLGIVQYGSNLDDKSSTFAIQARNPANNQVEFEYPLSAFSHALRVPVPEKAQKQYNFCLLPATDKITSVDAVIWTVNHGPLKSCHVHDAGLVNGPDDVLEQALNFVMQRPGGELVLPTEAEFASSLRESHRKADVAYHVKAFRGSKEGYLFFLSSGIFFGFKKPLLFFPFNEIDSISYTSVLQRTFNMNVLVRVAPDDEPQEIEFSMLDQADFAGIDAYVKKHQLQDASLAEARRAKKVGKASGAKDTSANPADDENAQTELEKAKQDLEDEEDEMEEDYDPDDDDDDDASGSESEADDLEYPKANGRNLVAEELGSEAEDVSQSEDEDDDEGGAEEEEEEEEEEEAVAVAYKPPETTVLPIKAQHRPHVSAGAPQIDDEDQL